jgi:hypothetical protein
MQIKWLFCILSALFFLSIIGCGSGGIICRANSAIGNSSGEKGMITIAWDFTDEPKLAGYRIIYGTAPGIYRNCIDIGKPPESSPGVTKYTLTGLSQGKKYFISVVAYSITKDSSAFSQEVSAVAK